MVHCGYALPLDLHTRSTISNEPPLIMRSFRRVTRACPQIFVRSGVPLPYAILFVVHMQSLDDVWLALEHTSQIVQPSNSKYEHPVMRFHCGTFVVELCCWSLTIVRVPKSSFLNHRRHVRDLPDLHLAITDMKFLHAYLRITIYTKLSNYFSARRTSWVCQ